MSELENAQRAFHAAMINIYEEARDGLGYVATRFVQMVADQGGLAAARRLLHSGPSEGFATLWERRRLDLSVEFHVLLPPFAPLFTDQERDIAYRRLQEYGFDVDRALARWTQDQTQREGGEEEGP